MQETYEQVEQCKVDIEANIPLTFADRYQAHY